MDTDVSLLLFAFLIAVAFFAGFIDSIAGGGGLLSLPALLVAGVPPQMALGTSKFMASCGTSVAVAIYSKNKKVDWTFVVRGILPCILGGLMGAQCALATTPHTLRTIMIFLLPFVALLVLRPMKRSALTVADKTTSHVFIKIVLICLAAGFYDGFFGPGTGTLLILALHFFFHKDMVNASGTSKIFNLATNVSSLVAFLLAGQVWFLAAIPMAIANIAGNGLGSKIAIRQGPEFIRKILIASIAILFTTLVTQQL